MSDRIVRLAILDTYGVRWSRETFARDLLQNFFDATPDFRSITMDIEPETQTVTIRGPVTFDAELLAYIGATTKTSGKSVGGFGEGFKICALVGTRDFGLTITAGTGHEQLVVLLDPVPLGRELCYRATHQDKAFEGSFVRLEGCDPDCIAAFQAAPNMFRHPDNPKLKKVLVEDEAQGIAVYFSSDTHRGELYYRRQLRGTASFWARSGSSTLTLVHDPIIDSLEGDRDRRDLPGRPLAIEIGRKLDQAALYKVIMTLMPYWQYGCDVLSGFLEAAMDRKLTYEWPPGWLARSEKGKHLEEFAERQGLKLAMYAFGKLGMRTADQNYGELETRPATPLERAQIQVVADLYKDLTGRAASIKSFEVFGLKGAAVLGQHLGDKVIVGAEVLEAGLDKAAPTILHELAHEKGTEESKPFLLQLTKLLGAAIRHPKRIVDARRQYKAAQPPPPEPDPPAAAAKEPEPNQPEPPKAYEPQMNWKRGASRVRGVVVTLVIPPAFPPTEALIQEILAASEQVDIPIFPVIHTVTGPKEAITFQAPGIPTLWVGNIDPEPPADAANWGYRLRTYGDNPVRLTPSRDAIAQAICKAKEADLTWEGKGIAANHKIREVGKAKIPVLLGIRSEKAQVEEAARKKRMEALQAHLSKYVGYLNLRYHDLHGFWSVGKHAAGQKILKQYVRDKRDPNGIWADIKAKLDKALNCSRALRRADPDFDDADEWERHAMAAAQGAAVVAFVQHKDEAQGKALAEQHFAAVRAITSRILDQELTLALKTPVLYQTLEQAGFDEDNPAGLDLKKLDAVYDRCLTLAIAYQRDRDESGKLAYDYDLEHILQDSAPTKPPSHKEMKQKREREQREARQVDDSWRLKAFYEEQLEQTGDPVVAAQRFLDEAARLWPEETP